jgi:hypothetical protein
MFEKYEKIPFEKFLISKQDHDFFSKFKRKRKTKLNNLNYAFIGSGGIIAYNNMQDILNTTTTNKTHGYEMIVSNMLFYLTNAIKKSSKKDLYTNGFVNIGILTNPGYVGINHFLNLNSKDDFYIAREKAVKKLRKETGTTKKSLDKILLKL